MSTFLVQKTVYVSLKVEASTWQDAMQKSAYIDLASWKQDDEETPCVTLTNPTK
jgi:hypothetical protein